MRTVVFLSAVLLVTILLSAQRSAPSSLFTPQQNAAPFVQTNDAAPSGNQRTRTGDGLRMWKRAEIIVHPLDVVVANRAELESLRSRAARLEADRSMLNVSDPAAREQLDKQLQLIKSLLTYAERAQSDAGKGPTAIEVQRHLNEIEGKVSCEACHSGLVARN